MNKKILVGISAVCLTAVFWACGDGDVITRSGDDELALLNYGPPFAEGDEGNMKTLMNQAMTDCSADKECAAKMDGSTYTPPESSADGDSSKTTPDGGNTTPSGDNNTPNTNNNPNNNSSNTTPSSSPSTNSNSSNLPASSNANTTPSSSSVQQQQIPSSSSVQQQQTPSSSSQQQTQPSSTSQNSASSGEGGCKKSETPATYGNASISGPFSEGCYEINTTKACKNIQVKEISGSGKVTVNGHETDCSSTNYWAGEITPLSTLSIDVTSGCRVGSLYVFDCN